MKLRYILIFAVCALGILSFGTLKKNKFLDFFTTLKEDSLVVTSPPHDKLQEPDATWSIKGTPIDTSFTNVYSKAEAEDLQYYINDNGENSTFGYYKVRLDLGYYLVIIRAAGEYWNSRVYACLYHGGENKVTHTILIGENFGDAGSTFTCNSVLRMKDKRWTISVHEYFSEPVDYHKYHNGDNPVLKVRYTDILYHIENIEDRYVFVEKDRKDKTELTK